MPKRLNLTGQRFGMLTVLRPAENIGTMTAWICRCDCGQETVIRTSHLRNGRTKSCGCRRGAGDPMELVFVDGDYRKRLDLAGQRFGMLTVLRPAENIGTMTAWVCRCDCGRETVIRTNHLRSGGNRSCGCSGGSRNARKSLTYVDGTCVEMLRSRKVQKNNTSGVCGVTRDLRGRMWRATICFKGKSYYLGSYQEFEDAVKARKQAEEDLYDKFLYEYANIQA